MAPNYLVTLEGRTTESDDDLNYVLMDPQAFGFPAAAQLPGGLIKELKATCDARGDDAYWAYPDIKEVKTEDGDTVDHQACLFVNAVKPDETWFALLLKKAGDDWEVIGMHVEEVVASPGFADASPEQKVEVLREALRGLATHPEAYATIHLIYPYEAGREYPF
ncbi:MAG: hypothetical protein Kow0069_07770 [Promethearchaeota archaeon]